MKNLRILSLMVGLSAIGCGDELKEPTLNLSSETKSIIGGTPETGFSSVAMIQYLEPTNDGSIQVNPPLVCSGVWFDTVDGCLLYTSPSPRDATLSRMPSSA